MRVGHHLRVALSLTKLGENSVFPRKRNQTSEMQGIVVRKYIYDFRQVFLGSGCTTSTSYSMKQNYQNLQAFLNFWLLMSYFDFRILLRWMLIISYCYMGNVGWLTITSTLSTCCLPAHMSKLMIENRKISVPSQQTLTRDGTICYEVILKVSIHRSFQLW